MAEFMHAHRKTYKDDLLGESRFWQAMCIRYKLPQTKYHKSKLKSIYANLERSRSALQKLTDKN
eukprot:8339192-Karenia_brevis.AAC.1